MSNNIQIRYYNVIKGKENIIELAQEILDALGYVDIHNPKKICNEFREFYQFAIDKQLCKPILDFIVEFGHNGRTDSYWYPGYNNSYWHSETDTPIWEIYENVGSEEPIITSFDIDKSENVFTTHEQAVDFLNNISVNSDDVKNEIVNNIQKFIEYAQYSLYIEFRKFMSTGFVDSKGNQHVFYNDKGKQETINSIKHFYNNYQNGVVMFSTD
jgi:hypothetical protein